MFTGIVEETGLVTSIVRKGKLAVLTVKAPLVAKGTNIGDSVANDGVCLTVTKKLKDQLSFDIMLESLRVTTLGNLKPGDRVNLERSVKVGDRMGGHFVTGHVDAVTAITGIVREGEYVEYKFAMNKVIAPYLAAKGSVTIDGISLTIGKVTRTFFSVYLIPHTLNVTTIGRKKVGDGVNIETDVLAKYIINSSQASLFKKRGSN